MSAPDQHAPGAIVRGGDLPAGDRQDYGIGRFGLGVRHFVTRTTTPGNPFGPHEHDGAEYWFILEGEATVSLDGVDHPVSAGDLIVLPPWCHHGLSSTGTVRWICMG